MHARAVFVAVALALAGLVGAPAASTPAASVPLSRGDLRWLARVTFGIDTTTVARYRALGRVKFLDEQLNPPASDPPSLAAAIAQIPVTQQTAQARITALRAEQLRTSQHHPQ